MTRETTRPFCRDRTGGVYGGHCSTSGNHYYNCSDFLPCQEERLQKEVRYRTQNASLNHESLLTPTKLRQVSLNQLSARAPRVLDHWSPRHKKEAAYIQPGRSRMRIERSSFIARRSLMHGA